MKAVPQTVPSPSGFGTTPNPMYYNSKSVVDNLQREADALEKVYEDSKNLADSTKTASKEYDSFSKQVADAKLEVTELSAELKELKLGKGNEADFSKAIDEKTKQLKDAQDKLDILTGNTKKEIKADKAANKQTISINERLASIITDTTKLKDIATKAEIELADAKISAMDEGYAKEKEQQKIKFKERMLAIKKQGEEMLKLQNDIAEKEFLVKNPKGVPPIAGTTLSSENQEVINKLTQAASLENQAFEEKLLKDKLIEYGDYATERLEIEKKFNADIKALESERNKTNSEQIDAAVIQAQTEKAKALMAQSFKKLKESPEFAMAFEDLGNVSTATLEKLMDELEKYKSTAAGTMKLSDFKEYSKVIENVTDEFIKRNPFKVLKESADDLLFAQRKLQSAKEIQSMVESGLSVNQKGELIPIGSTERAISYEQALEGVAQAQNNVTTAQNKGTKALTTITDAFGELSKNLSAVGNSIGGTAGVVLSSIGDIGSIVTSSISAWKAASIGAASAIHTVEKASIILSVISAVITVATTIANLFTSASKKRREEAEKERKAILEVKKAYLEAYAAMSNKKFDNIFGDDVWGKAKEQVKLIKEAGKNFADAYLGIVEKFGTASKFKNFLDNYLEVPGDWSKKLMY